MRKMLLMLAALLVLTATTVAMAQQTDNTPPSYPTGPAYNYCQAKSHAHDVIYTTTLYFWGRGLAESECNNGGNFFYGNLLHLYYWSYRYTYWYDWSADPNAGVKLNVWDSNPGEPITVRYCATCKMALTATSPRVPE